MKVRRVNPVLADFVRDNAAAFTPKELLDQVARRPELASYGIPSLRTVQTLVSETRTSSGATKSPDEYALGALTAMAALAEQTGRWPTLTTQVAERIVELRRDFPDIPPREYLPLASADAARLRPYLAFEPWKDGGQRYIAAYGRGLFGRLILTASTASEFRRWTEKKKEAAEPEGPTAPAGTLAP